MKVFNKLTQIFFPVNVGILDLDHLVASDEPNYNNLSDYIELLYEGMPEKIKGAQLIQLLARDPDNLDALSKNGKINLCEK